MEPYLDTIKSFLYLLLSIGISWLFWNRAERYAKKGLHYVDPFLFIVMVIWGASGFFFFSFILHFIPTLYHSIIGLFLKPIPDWDISLYIWANHLFSDTDWDLFKHRSWLFSSVIIPILLMVISILIVALRKSISSKSFRVLNSIIIGLFVGISSHLSGDLVFSFIPRGNIGYKIYDFNTSISQLWFASNILLGISIPFLIICLTSAVYKKNKTT